MCITKKNILMLMLAIALTLSSCSAIPFGTNQMMSPPKLSDRNQRVIIALNNSLTMGYHLTYALRGNDSSPVRFIDICGEGETGTLEEAVAIYRPSGIGDKIFVHVLTQEKGMDWETLYDIPLEGIDCDFIDFQDINNDKKMELIIGRTTTDPKNNILSVYSFNNNTAQEIYSCNYMDMRIIQPGINTPPKIFYIFNNLAQGIREGKTASFDGTKMTVQSSVEMDPEVTQYESIIISSIKESIENENAKMLTAIYCNGIKSATIRNINAGVTELLYIDNNDNLVNPFFSKEKNAVTLTANVYSILPMDINNDNILEIPLLKRLSPEDTPASTTVWQIDWYKYDAGKNELIEEANMLYNPQMNYAVKLLPKWTGKVMVASEDSGRCWTVNPADEPNTTLYKIYSQSPSDYYEHPNSQILYSNTSIIISIAKGIIDKNYNGEYKDMLLTDKELKEIFIFEGLRNAN